MYIISGKIDKMSMDEKSVIHCLPISIRTPLKMPISAVLICVMLFNVKKYIAISKMQDVTDFVKGVIIGCHKNGQSSREISN